MILRLKDEERATFLDAVHEQLEARGAPTPRSPFIDGLALRVAGRAPIAAALADLEDDEEPPPARGEAFLAEVVKFTVDEILVLRLGELFPLMTRIVEKREDAAFVELLELLNERIKIKGILYRRGLDPDREYPGLWSKIWEAIGKWDGRDFLAYIGRCVRNYCTDDLKRRKKSPHEMPEELGDRRPTYKTADKVGSRDALVHVLAVLDELEAEGSIAPIDGVIFALITAGRAVQDITALLADPVPMGALEKAVVALVGPKKKLEQSDTLVVRYLVDGLEADEIALLTGKGAKAIGEASKALAPIVEAGGEYLLLARAFAREGVGRVDLERGARLTVNAVNLRINRARLRMWMAINDRAYDAIRRRGAIDEVELAIVQHRCTAEGGPWCRMYKDRTCKRERSPAEIARKASLSIPVEELERRMDSFREKILDGLGRAFPDYNSCLNERKPDRPKGASRHKGEDGNL